MLCLNSKQRRPKMCTLTLKLGVRCRCVFSILYGRDIDDVCDGSTHFVLFVDENVEQSIVGFDITKILLNPLIQLCAYFFIRNNASICM